MSRRTRKLHYWQDAPMAREQLVLIPTALEALIPSDHPVRLVDEILDLLDWTPWEAVYHGSHGQPPIHPSVLAKVLLFAMIRRLRSSRQIEYELKHSIDFMWLTSGRRIDHTTLSEFRRKHSGELRDIFKQMIKLAIDLKIANLAELCIDGTRVLANANRYKTWTSERLAKALAQLDSQIAEALATLEVSDSVDEDLLGDDVSAERLPEGVADLQSRREQLASHMETAKAMDDLRKTNGSKGRAQLPKTDPDSRILPSLPLDVRWRIKSSIRRKSRLSLSRAPVRVKRRFGPLLRAETSRFRPVSGPNTPVTGGILIRRWEGLDGSRGVEWKAHEEILCTIVNGASVFILGHKHEHSHVHEHDDDEKDHSHSASHHRDHNLRAAYLHVLADALTSLLAIFALLAGKHYGLIWMDPLMGIIGAILVARWSVGLLYTTSAVLLDRQGPERIRNAVHASIEGHDDNRVADLHVWSIGPNTYAVELAIVTHDPQPPDHYKHMVPKGIGLAHVSVEVHECVHDEQLAEAEVWKESPSPKVG